MKAGAAHALVGDDVVTAMRLTGRRALVSGAASGIGRATAVRLASEGARVLLCDVRSEGLEEARTVAGPDALAVACDVGSEPDVGRCVSRACEAWGGLDTVVCCAGIVRAGATHTTTLEEWNTLLRVNLTGTFLVLKHALPRLVASGRGAIVTVGSVASVVAAGRTSGYDASKGGVLQLTRAVAVEYVDQGVRANCVLPGVVETALAANSAALHGPLGHATNQSAASRLRIPMARAAQPDEIAATIAFLVSDDASFITGAAIAADGGYTAI